MIWEKVKALEEELLRLKSEREKIIEELGSLPNGHIDVKVINGHKYYYLRYWEEGRLKSKYLGKDASELIQKLNRANELKRNLSLIKEREKKLEKILEKISKALEEFK
ncbi:MAG: hypothetical protein QXV69_03820 [Sulfolobaceae archaeon]